MSDPAARLWLLQADSDLRAAERVWNVNDHWSYCQAMAKYQQAVEKSVKAMFSAVKDFGIGLPAIGYNHDLSRLLDVLKRLSKAADATVQQRIGGILTSFHRAEIKTISALAPRRPDRSRGHLHQLNTEYPYETAAGVWAAPAAPGLSVSCKCGG